VLRKYYIGFNIFPDGNARRKEKIQKPLKKRITGLYVIIMATKALNLKLDESKILDIKRVSNAFHITMTDVFNEALDEYLTKMKKDPFYRLTANIADASTEETAEVLNEIAAMTDDDLLISSVHKITV